MKKHSKTGVESRFQGTVLGHTSDPRPVKIEGGPSDSIQDWCRRTQEKAAIAAKEKAEKSEKSGLSTPLQMSRAVSEDVVMDTQ
jgi:transcription initiation factor TFIID subunit 3